jgi:hypothetical protein
MSGIETLAILLLAASLLAVAAPRRVAIAEDGCFREHLIDGLGPYITKLFGILAALAITVLAE